MTTRIVCIGLLYTVGALLEVLQIEGRRTVGASLMCRSSGTELIVNKTQFHLKEIRVTGIRR